MILKLTQLVRDRANFQQHAQVKFLIYCRYIDNWTAPIPKSKRLYSNNTRSTTRTENVESKTYILIRHATLHCMLLRIESIILMQFFVQQTSTIGIPNMSSYCHIVPSLGS